MIFFASLEKENCYLERQPKKKSSKAGERDQKVAIITICVSYGNKYFDD